MATKSSSDYKLWQLVPDVVSSAPPGWYKQLVAQQLSYRAESIPPVSSQLFEDAIEYINEHGWCQNAEATTEGRVCLRGAFGKAVVGSHFSLDGEAVRLVRHLDEAGLRTAMAHQREILTLMGVDTDRFRVIPAWNDEPGRTKEEVIDALTLAAKTLRDQGR